jgi:phage terminase large subunit
MMTMIELHRNVFNNVYLPHLHSTERTQILFGGASSGKSVFLAQRCVYDLLDGERNYLICRQVGRTIAKSVAQEIQKIIRDWRVSHLFTINKTDGTITCNRNHKQAVFVGLDDVEKLKSITPQDGVFTDVWVEEATEVEENSIRQLLKRQRGGSEDTPKRLTLSFNPIMQSHWIYQRYFSKIGWADGQTEHRDKDTLILKTTYKDNRFLTAEDIAGLEAETDTYYYEVYTLGNWGVLGDVIFTNWRVEDLSGKHDQFTNHRTGLDFGFSSDPAALWVAHYDKPKKTIYVYDELYERGLTNDVLASILVEKIGQQYVTCDSAEPKSIKELQNAGVYALGARKGKDSVNFGIQWLQQQTIIFDKGCVNAIAEFSTAHWKKDKDGNSLRVPSDKNNHLIDAARYAHEQDSTETETTSIENPLWL